MAERAGVRIRAAVLAALLLLCLFPGPGRAEAEVPDLTAAAFELLEEGNPFVRRYEKLTGKEITPLFPWGVPYYYGGLSGSKGNGWFYMAYPDYFIKMCEHGSGYFKVGERYFYGLDCIGFTRHVYKACGLPAHPSLADIMTQWEQKQYHVYDSRKGHEAPPYDQLKNTLRVGDLLVVKHEDSKSRHVMMYIGTLRSFGYTAEEEPALASWLDWPLVIHCGLSPFYGERFQKLIDEYPDKYGKATTTDGGVAISLLGPKPENAPEHGHVQNTDYAWFTMNDGGYQLTVVNLTDVKYYAWYRP
ncbi:MAG: C40 family peptidase [Clostridia bacterium]|nr:C40 family peptidase [Clostridia bacterium]